MNRSKTVTLKKLADKSYVHPQNNPEYHFWIYFFFIFLNIFFAFLLHKNIQKKISPKNPETFFLLANRPPPAAFCSPFGNGRYKSCKMVNKNRHTYGTDRQTHIWDRHTWPMKNSLHAKNFFVWRQISTQIVSKPPQAWGESVHVLKLKIHP